MVDGVSSSRSTASLREVLYTARASTSRPSPAALVRDAAGANSRYSGSIGVDEGARLPRRLPGRPRGAEEGGAVAEGGAVPEELLAEGGGVDGGVSSSRITASLREVICIGEQRLLARARCLGPN